MLEFYQFYSAENTRRDTHKTWKPLFSQMDQKPFFETCEIGKTVLLNRKHLKNRENCKKMIFWDYFSKKCLR